MKIGDRVEIQSKKQTRSNGLTGKITAVEGKYYRVVMDGSGSSRLFMAHELIPSSGIKLSPPPNNDYTTARRIQNRRQRLTEIAKAAGFEGWSQLETALLNGQAEIVEK